MNEFIHFIHLQVSLIPTNQNIANHQNNLAVDAKYHPRRTNYQASLSCQQRLIIFIIFIIIKIYFQKNKNNNNNNNNNNNIISQTMQHQLIEFQAIRCAA
jgi:hypothetical protein